MEFREMEEGGTVTRSWEDMDNDILVKIFQSLTVFELTSGIAHVCSAWRWAACDPLLWKTLDLSMLKSNFIKIPLKPYVYVHGHSDKTLTRILKISLSLSRGNITSLFFHCNLYVSEDHLTYTAQRLISLKWSREATGSDLRRVYCKFSELSGGVWESGQVRPLDQENENREEKKAQLGEEDISNSTDNNQVQMISINASKSSEMGKEIVGEVEGMWIAVTISIGPIVVSRLKLFRCPCLRRLVLPAWNRVETVMIEAIDLLKDLESLTMPSIVNSPRLVQAIATNCRNFSELKIMGPFDIYFASSLVTYLPSLKVLSLRCSMLCKDTLIFILDNLRCLEVLNISHCLLTEVPPTPAPRRIVRQLDKTILEKASWLRKFLTCMRDTCIMCQRTRNDEGLMRWYKYDEGLWKEDEVRSLAV
ncbi:hypothetical protein SADUNF_Sadunf12G0107600 [Salix dunnii]|uniref:F-box domain-containing protein n=1 Tax=Salix dunnii TaxID=1413687 RepID=A0A835MPT8_9ROSI|nr:hypothetical protein SADUNF_Sadunf12G0107600 [Salix dunnii]